MMETAFIIALTILIVALIGVIVNWILLGRTTEYKYLYAVYINLIIIGAILILF